MQDLAQDLEPAPRRSGCLVGVWRPPSVSAGGGDPTFHEFASRWWFARKSELRPTTQADYEWRLRKHLLPFFADFQVSAITIALVDEYRGEKVIERERISAAAAAGRPIRDRRGQRRVALSNESINKTLVLLANILDTAVEHGLLASNPARSKRRRLKAGGPTRRLLEADELAELLTVAGELDRSARSDQRIGRRAAPVCDGPGRSRRLEDHARDLCTGAEANLAQERSRGFRPVAQRRGQRGDQRTALTRRVDRDPRLGVGAREICFDATGRFGSPCVPT
jgi:Phage integrase, N-terminal SAM-like domain